MTLPRVLIVHGDPFARRFLSRVLADSYELSVAKDGREALSRLAAERFDVVLSDVPATASDGGEVAAEIRATSPDTEVILVAGVRERARDEDVRAPDVLECLPDPFDPDTTIRALQRAVERKAFRAEIQRLREELHRARDGSGARHAE